MDLREIDLNLLVIFNQLLVDRRVGVAAESLGISQPAVSNALVRLRRRLGDELFLRTSRGMEPTPFAARLAEPVAHALGTLEAALNQRASFVPATSRRPHPAGNEPHRHGTRALRDRCVERFGLAYVPHPANLPEIAIRQFWQARFHREPGNTWLRGASAEMFSGPVPAPTFR